VVRQPKEAKQQRQQVASRSLSSR